jgi:hypothetical protein
MNRKSIWLEKQNKPTLIVRDLKEKYPEIDEDFIYEVLLRRGVFKWLSVRRDLIKLKNKWKTEITELCRQQTIKKDRKKSGRLGMIMRLREEVRKLCHSERWVAPDFDKKANLFLINYNGGDNE